MKQLIELETEVEKQREEIRLLNDKLNERKYDCGAVAVLRDKLMAKEKVIEQQVVIYLFENISEIDFFMIKVI